MLAALRKPAPPAAARAPGKAEAVTELIGNTPLLEIRNVTRGLSPAVRVLAKLEGLNPGGSVKDRPALRMIREAIGTGRLRPGRTIIDSTSGNTGIAVAMIGAALGYPVRLVLPANVSEERKGIIRFFGAETVYSDPMEGSDGGHPTLPRDRRRRPGSLFQARPVLQPHEQPGPLRDHGPGNLSANRGERHPLRRRDRHRRHRHGHRALPEGTGTPGSGSSPRSRMRRCTGWRG